MKVLGFVIIIIGFILLYVGVTGNQHNLMDAITGKANPNTSTTAAGSNSNPGNVQLASDVTPTTNSNPPTGTQVVP